MSQGEILVKSNRITIQEMGVLEDDDDRKLLKHAKEIVREDHHHTISARKSQLEAFQSSGTRSTASS